MLEKVSLAFLKIFTQNGSLEKTINFTPGLKKMIYAWIIELREN